MKRIVAALLLGLALAFPAFAQLDVAQPWVRATVPQQKATGAFMELTAQFDARLVDVKSPVAGIAEVHEMLMDGKVMKMRRLHTGLELPAGKAVELKPGGYHIMLMALKRQLLEGESVPLTLVLEDKKGKRSIVETTATVRAVQHQGGAHK